MSKIEQLIDINRKIAKMNYTNSEVLELLKNDSVINYVNKLFECELNHKSDSEFLKCFLISSCPDELTQFQKCSQINQENPGVCSLKLLELEQCMKKYPNNVLSILSKTSKYS